MIGSLKLTVQVKLQASEEQSEALRRTLETVNKACNWLSEKVWETKEFRQFPLHRSFYQLGTFVVYKAARAGVPVRFVDPRNTSRTCSECDCVNPRNRKTRDAFRCVRCGHEMCADVNAAKNIRRAACKPAVLFGLS
jgi:transposase